MTGIKGNIFPTLLSAISQLVICNCRNQECSVIKHSSTNTKNKAKKSSESDKDDTPNAKTKDTSHILLVMADGAFRNYLRKALSKGQPVYTLSFYLF